MTGVIKIVTVGSQGSVSLEGAVIGMPDGIKRVDELRSLGFLNKLGCGLAALIEIAAVGSVPFIFFWITGSWANVWLLILPFVALFVPAIMLAIVAATIWPNSSPELPSSLSLPSWAHRLEFMRYHAIEMHRDPRVMIEYEARQRENKSNAT